MYYTIVKAILRFVFHIAFSLKYEGLENIPKDTVVIFTSNHRTNADPPLIGSSAYGKHAFMAKEELFENKFLSLLIRSLGAFPVSRGKGDMGAIDTAVQKLKSGRSLIIFPEGTRSKDGKVHKGQSGAALIAAKSGKPIVPVGIVFGEKLKFRTKLTIKYGKPIITQDYVEISDEPNLRQISKLKKRYMEEIKLLVEGEPEILQEDSENA